MYKNMLITRTNGSGIVVKIKLAVFPFTESNKHLKVKNRFLVRLRVRHSTRLVNINSLSWAVKQLCCPISFYLPTGTLSSLSSSSLSAFASWLGRFNKLDMFSDVTLTFIHMLNIKDTYTN